MKPTELLLLAGLIYLAPHTPTRIGRFAGITMLIAAVIYGFTH